MRRRLSIWVVVFAAVAFAYLWLRPRAKDQPFAYVGERSATLWSSAAQVRQPIATLRFGERVQVLQRHGEQAEVRTSAGDTGWMEARLLVEPSLWQRSMGLLDRTRSLPVQATGQTKVPTNVRVEPGRAAARIYQFGRGVHVEVFARAAAEWTLSAEEHAAAPNQTSGEEQKVRREDWLLVRGQVPADLEGSAVAGAGLPAGSPPGENIAVAGWVVARFIEPDLPGPVRDYTSASGLRVLAWFELNRVPDRSGEKPQYLVAGVRGAEGQECDFTLLRVYTWGARRQQYETAYLESGFCGYLPIRVSAGKGPKELEFRFTALGKRGKEERVYGMRQTVVRRVREAGRR